ncbi:MAG: SRPBCC domain-containing protein [Alphaproteobacteria bacterium]|nr:SRPBCC domain-containing protein [Alphaproteobacteria bacterium]
MSGRVVQTTAELPCTEAVAWAVLADLPAWPTWNPAVASLDGELALGARLRLGLRQGDRTVTVGVRITRLEPGRVLAWVGGVPGLTTAEHTFALEPVAPGPADAAAAPRCRFVHTEAFSGVLPWLLWPWLRARLLPRYEATNAGLAARVVDRDQA